MLMTSVAIRLVLFGSETKELDPMFLHPDIFSLNGGYIIAYFSMLTCRAQQPNLR